MSELKFDTGVKTYTINGVCEVSFNPTDNQFVQRLYNAFHALDGKQEAYKEEIENLKDDEFVFEIARRRDKEMREVIDGIFKTKVCDSVFHNMNVYAMANGLPVWCNFLLAIMDELDVSFAKEQRATNPRVQDYLKRYHK